ncbi:MAG TPA: hypothetical protein ENI87_07125 [bacterium]|nr:hypothetical protein [bacterium]
MRHPLYLHIGHPKTASSTIQAAIAQNVDALRAEGFLVANAQMQFDEQGPQRGMPVQYVADMIERREAGLAAALQRFHELGERLGGAFDKVLVSAESLCIPDAEVLAQALRHAFEIHVIYYLRRQDEWLVSAWGQWGCQEGVALSDYVERQLAIPQPNFAKVIGRWRGCADNLRVRPLHPSALVHGDVTADFFAAIGARHRPKPPARNNESLDLALQETFASSPFLFESYRDKTLPGWLRTVTPAGFPLEKGTLGEALLARIRDTFAQQNRELHREFFPQVDYDTVFGPHADAHEREQIYRQQTSDAATIARLRRVVGLQLHLLHDLQRRIERLERRERLDHAPDTSGPS